MTDLDPTPPDSQIPTPFFSTPNVTTLSCFGQQCIEETKQAAINCTLATLAPPYDPISNLEKMAEYYRCLDQMREDLLACDRRAKADTHCPDQNTPPDCSGQEQGPRLAQNSAERFLDSIRTTPLKPGDEGERIA